MMPGSRRAVVGLGLAATAVLALHVAHLVQPTGPIGSGTYLAVTVAAAVVALIGAARRPRSSRLPWLLVALGITSSAVGDVLFEIDVLQGGDLPDASVADAFWLGAYAFIGVGLLVLERRARHGAFDFDGLLDTAAVGVVALLVAWQVSVQATLTDSSRSVLIRALFAAYPVLDSLILAQAVRLLLSRRSRSSVGIVFGAGVGLWLMSDLSYVIAPEGPLTRWYDLGWMGGVAIMSVAMWRGSSHGEDVVVAGAARPLTARRAMFGVALVGAPVLVDAVGYLGGTDLNPIPILLATALLAGIVFARMFRLLRAQAVARSVLQSSQRYYRSLATYASDVVLVLDRDGIVVNDVPSWGPLESALPWPTPSRVRLADLVPTELPALDSLLRHASEAPGQPFSDELRLGADVASTSWVALRVVDLLHDPDVGGVLVDVQEVSARRRAEAELEHQAFHDALTGTANRALFRDRVAHALARNAGGGDGPAIVHLDLDGFKTVNETLGHEVGDEVLRAVARLLGTVMRSGDTVARLGGDEFGLLVEQPQRDGVDVTRIGQRVVDALRDPIVVGDREVNISASLGIAFSDGDDTATTLLRNADVAMSSAKRAGKARWVVFDPVMRDAAVERLQLESDLGAALEQRRLHVSYQPVVDLVSGRVAGFEALLRWDHPTLGAIAPDRFVPIAEANGLIFPIGRWVLAEACTTCARWRREVPGAEALTIAVNVSGRQLGSDELIADVEHALATSGLDPAALVLELTETVLVRDPLAAAARLRELRALGVRVAVDDFGMGYSSLSYLRQFPLDILKIDRSFVTTITSAGSCPPLLRGLIDLGHTLCLELVAEGIELDVQRDALRSERCQFGQGFLFARPLGAEAAELLLRQEGVAAHVAERVLLGAAAPERG